MVDNEIRRIKAKLKLFDMEGFNWVLMDLLEITTKDTSSEVMGAIIDNLKLEYLERLEFLIPKDSKQQKLEL